MGGGVTRPLFASPIGPKVPTGWGPSDLKPTRPHP